MLFSCDIPSFLPNRQRLHCLAVCRWVLLLTPSLSGGRRSRKSPFLTRPSGSTSPLVCRQGCSVGGKIWHRSSIPSLLALRPRSFSPCYRSRGDGRIGRAGDYLQYPERRRHHPYYRDGATVHAVDDGEAGDQTAGRHGGQKDRSEPSRHRDPLRACRPR